MNDMVDFEPCTAYKDSELRSLGLDPATRSDIAIVDNFKWRGCVWELPKVGPHQHIPGAVDQGIIQGQWEYSLPPDDPYDKLDHVVNIGGYRVAVAYATDGNECMYWVNANPNGLIMTTVTPYQLKLMSHQQACEIAEKFTRLMIPKLPKGER